ncbi:DUF5777 family beta-barrel protein [Sediminibacterium sp.]|uniref:DUF5777 family beta-barrel protein n=1 Tax=Sediminibacterium sp. TaxID=1917865 RepID=UPI002732D9A3|nr:DUF5777 family beta-barrel protein [Sediminibacterium sp.]MDP3394456.1 DUF5777 family beta-barrel protein [Sediminibacterium sp.]MDP3568291.1 DUF5777 family beta-barrel protein [Sediminibacterium sp.]
MIRTPFAILCFISLFSFPVFAQDNLLKELENEQKGNNKITGAFKSSRVINGHSMEMLGAGMLDFRILHRFGPVKQGIGDLFGLDQASMRMGFDFGLSNNLTIGFGRTSFKKEYDAFIKYRLIHQEQRGTPVSLIAVAGTSIFTYKSPDPLKPLTFTDRTGYYAQLIIGRKFNESFSLQLSPTLVYRNMIDPADKKTIYALGIGARHKISKRVAFVVDYSLVANGLPMSVGTNPLSIGVDIETGGHVFQLHFSNSTGMNERSFITETTNSWSKGEFQFGFNLSRIFSLKK